MNYHVFKIEEEKIMKSVLKKFDEGFYTENFKIQNLAQLKEDKELFMFNIILQKETPSVYSREVWYKIYNGFISTKYNLILIPVFDLKDLVQLFKEEIFITNEWKITLEKCNINHINNLKDLDNYYISSVTYLNESNEVQISNNTDVLQVDENELSILEITYFDNNNGLFHYNGEGILNCNQDKIYNKNLQFFS